MTLQKSRLMFLMELLNRETDEEHPITIAEIIDRLKAEGFSANRHTIAGDLNTLMATVNGRMPGIMNKADAALAKAGTTLDNTSTLTANLAAVDVAGTMQQVNNTLANVQQITEKLNSKQGTLGLLMNDPALYNNLNATMISADSLLTNLKAHPKRYVHFSLFGKKDK